MLIVFILLAGMRYRIGLDTIRYMYSYESIPTLGNLMEYDFSTSEREPFWIFLSSITKSLCCDFSLFQFLHAIILNTTVFWFVRKYTEYVFTGILFYFVFLYANFNFEVMRESLAIAIFLIAYSYMRQNKWIQYLVLCSLSSLTHSFALVTFLFPFFNRLKLNRLIIIMLVGVFTFFSQIKEVLFDIIPFFLITEQMESKVTMYLNSDYFVNNGLSIIGQIESLINTLVFPLLSLGFANRTVSQKQKHHTFSSPVILLSFLTIVNINILIFYRFLNYFMIFYIVVLSDAFKYLMDFNKRVLIKQLIPFFILVICVFKLYGNFAPEWHENEEIRRYHRYYPYRTILLKREDPTREELFEHYGL